MNHELQGNERLNQGQPEQQSMSPDNIANQVCHDKLSHTVLDGIHIHIVCNVS